MRKVILFSLSTLFLFSTSVFGQISIASISKEKVVEDVEFDVTKKKQSNVMAYKNQELFIIPKSEKLRRYGYDYFLLPSFTKNDSKYDDKFVYKPNGNKVMPRTAHDSIAGKTFIVDSISYYKESLYMFYLRQKDNSDNKCIYLYNTQFGNYDLLPVAYFNNIKSQHINKSYIIRNNRIHSNDIKSGEPIVFGEKSYGQWECVDVSLDPDYFTIILVLSNGKNTTYTSYNETDFSLIEVSEWNSMVSKYGIENMNKVMDNLIYKGMPVTLLYLSWGAPQKINSASYGDQYVYGNQYVYVEKGVVTSWN
jgi:hypothetical protein